MFSSKKKSQDQQDGNEQQNNSLPKKQEIKNFPLLSLEEIINQAENIIYDKKDEVQKKIDYIYTCAREELKKWEEFLIYHSSASVFSELCFENSKHIKAVNDIYSNYSNSQKPEEESATVEKKSVYFIDKLRLSYEMYHSALKDIINRHVINEEHSLSFFTKIKHFFIWIFSWFQCLSLQYDAELNIRAQNAQSYDTLLKKVGTFKPSLPTYVSFDSLFDSKVDQNEFTHKKKQSNSDLYKMKIIFKIMEKKIRGAFTNAPINAPEDDPSIDSDYPSYNPCQRSH